MKGVAIGLVTCLLASVGWSAVLERNFDLRIANGYAASPGQFPYQVLLIGFAGSSSYLCGGTIISKNFILTAAHCCVGILSFEIHVGAHNFQNSGEPDRVVLSSSQTIVHENYNAAYLHNDIALIRTNRDITFTAKIQPAKLPPYSTDTYEGAILVGSGWGRLSNTGSIASVLQYGIFRAIGNPLCSTYYGSIITSGSLCAQGINLESVCFGDSGGPLALNGTDKVIGITSFVSSATQCSAQRPNGFVRIPFYLDWIAAKSGVTP